MDGSMRQNLLSGFRPTDSERSYSLYNFVRKFSLDQLSLLLLHLISTLPDLHGMGLQTISQQLLHLIKSSKDLKGLPTVIPITSR